MAPQSRLRRLIRALAHRISGPVIGEAAVEHQCDLAVVFYDVIFQSLGAALIFRQWLLRVITVAWALRDETGLGMQERKLVAAQKRAVFLPSMQHGLGFSRRRLL